MEWKSSLNPDILSVLMIAPDRMSLVNLTAYLRHLSDNAQKTQRYEIALWKKLVYPAAALVMVALALPFGYTHNRVSGVQPEDFLGRDDRCAVLYAQRPVFQSRRHQQLVAGPECAGAIGLVPAGSNGDDLVGRATLIGVMPASGRWLFSQRSCISRVYRPADRAGIARHDRSRPRSGQSPRAGSKARTKGSATAPGLAAVSEPSRVTSRMRHVFIGKVCRPWLQNQTK